MSVWKRLQARDSGARHIGPSERTDVRTRANLHIEALGSGSDYSPFLQHAGMPSANLGYGGEDQGGVYHSVYDDFYWYTHFSDTNFVYGRALAQTVGTAVMRIADAQLIPYDFTRVSPRPSASMRRQLDTLAKHEADSIAELNREVRDGIFVATNDPQRPTFAPDTLTPAPHLDFAPLQNGVEALNRAAQRTRRRSWRPKRTAARLSQSRAREVNEKILRSEQTLTSPDGLPGRPWYRHLLYAPGFYTGYGVKTVPGVREAIEQHQWAQADSQIVRVAAVLNAEAALLTDAAHDLSALAKGPVQSAGTNASGSGN